MLLLKGAAALLLTDLLLMGLATKQKETLRSPALAMDGDLAREWSRMGHYHVVESGGVVGVVDDVMADRRGTPRGLIVSDGWFGRQRFLVPLDDLVSIDDDERTVTIAAR